MTFLGVQRSGSNRWRLGWTTGAAVLQILAAGSAAGQPPSRDGANERFRALYEAEWAWRLEQTRGTGEEEIFDQVPDRLPRADEQAHRQRLVYWDNVLRGIEKIDPSALSDNNRVNLQVYRYQIETLANRQRFRDYEMPLRSFSAFWTDLRSSVRAMPFRTAEDYRRYIRFLGDFNRYFDENIANMRAGLDRGFSQPRVVLTGRDAAVAAVAEALGAESTPFFEPFRTMPAALPATEQALLRKQGADAIRTSVIPAHSRLLRFLRDEYFPRARTTLAASELPDGRAYYRSKMLEFVTVDLDPEEVHELGLREVASLRKEMATAMREAGFAGSLAEFVRSLRTDPRFYARTPDELLAVAAVISKEVDGKLERFFGILPRRRFGIYPMPADIGPYGTGASGGAGYYYLNTYNLPARPLYVMPALTLHEAAPGHAFQVPIALEQEGLPAFRQRFYISAFGEGWALYAERLGEEMGMYHDAYQRFGMLSYQIYRAARLVVDTGIHVRSWSREQAIAYMRENTSLNGHEIETEVDRYISAPAQALSYYLGASAIWRLRREAETALGERFDIRRFHDAVLQLGSVPLPVLESQVRQFIGAEQARPAAR